MPQTKPNPLVRLLPSFTDVAFLAPIAFLFARMEGAKTMLSDGDTGWHVRTGEWILANSQVPHRDIFSFTKAGDPWFAWEWLWDAVFAWMYQRAGMAAVVLMSVLVISLTSALLYRLVRRQCGNVLIAMAVTLLAMAGCSLHFLARPHLLTLLFLVIFYSILERLRGQAALPARTRLYLLGVLPALTVLWTNLHGGFLAGIILIGTYAAGELANALLESQPAARSQALARSRLYLLSAAGCFLASFLNPYFYHLHVHIYGYLTDSFQRQHIQEFMGLSFQHPAAIYFEVALLLGCAAAFWNLSGKRCIEALLVVTWAHQALLSGRNIPLFMILSAPVIAVAVCAWLSQLQESAATGWLRRLAGKVENLAGEIGQIDRVARVHLVSVAAGLVVAALFYAPAPTLKFRAEYDPKVYPAGALRMLRQSGLSGHIFTHDEWGDYLIYSLYPKTRVFVDGRSDFYGTKFEEKYLDVMAVKYDWERNLSRFGIDTILLPPDTPLSGALKESSRWRAVYDDGVAIVFRAVRGGQPEGEQVSAACKSSGTDRDRKITSSDPSDQAITKSKRKNLGAKNT